MCPVTRVIDELQHGGLHIYPIARPALREAAFSAKAG